jgi:hypothetical protein
MFVAVYHNERTNEMQWIGSYKTLYAAQQSLKDFMDDPEAEILGIGWVFHALVEHSTID